MLELLFDVLYFFLQEDLVNECHQSLLLGLGQQVASVYCCRLVSKREVRLVQLCSRLFGASDLPSGQLITQGEGIINLRYDC